MTLEPDLQVEYHRCLNNLGRNEPKIVGALTAEEVLRAHFLIANQFVLEGEGIGGIGPKSPELLESAVWRQFTTFGSKTKWSNNFELCATLFFGLIKNHPFHDANKRTAFLSALLHLRKNGFCVSVPEKEFEDLTVEVAENNLGKYSRYREMKKSNSSDPEVHFISWYLRKNTRRIDKENYAITYRELQTILHRFDCSLENPNNNHIDVMKKVSKRTLFGFGRPVTEWVKVAQIGFPRWTDQVGPQAVKTVRKATSLDYESGVDSAAFYKGLDTTQSLITSYHEALRSLAYR